MTINIVKLLRIFISSFNKVHQDFSDIHKKSKKGLKREEAQKIIITDLSKVHACIGHIMQVCNLNEKDIRKILEESKYNQIKIMTEKTDGLIEIIQAGDTIDRILDIIEKYCNNGMKFIKNSDKEEFIQNMVTIDVLLGLILLFTKIELNEFNAELHKAEKEIYDSIVEE